jgi:6-phosphogluconolactonase/glucosamine-6-phosphate isomerase/deaminase
MKVIVEPNAQAYSETVSALIVGQCVQDRRVNLSLTAGSSPKGPYKILAPWLKRHPDEIEKVHFYTFDYLDYEGYDHGFSEFELSSQLYGPAEIRPENQHWLDRQSYDTYVDEIEVAGGIDLMLIGMGADGHFCANMPFAARFDQDVYSIAIDPEYPWYPSFQAIYSGTTSPEDFLTLGAKFLMKVKHLVLIVNGESKAEAVKRFLSDETISPEFPVSILRLHPNLTVVLDSEAASSL